MGCFDFFCHKKPKEHMVVLNQKAMLYPTDSGTLRYHFVGILLNDPSQFVEATPTITNRSQANSKIVAAYNTRVYGEFDLSKKEYDLLVSQLKSGRKIDGLFVPDQKTRNNAANKLYHHLIKCHVEIQDKETEVWKFYKTISFHFRCFDGSHPFQKETVRRYAYDSM